MAVQSITFDKILFHRQRRWYSIAAPPHPPPALAPTRCFLFWSGNRLHWLLF